MTKSWAITLKGKPFSLLSLLGGAAAIVSLLIWTGCGTQSPFPASDPPPTFAIHYTLASNSGVYYPGLLNGYSDLKGNYIIDIVGTAYTPDGSVGSFGPASVTLGTYYTVDGARWPAQWTIGSVDGCGSGTSDNFDITQKIVEVVCTPRTGWMRVSPSSYGVSIPDTLLLSFNTAEVPTGTSADIYFVDSAGHVNSKLQIITDSNGQATVNTPDLPNGTFHVVANFDGLSTAYGAQTSLTHSCPNGVCP